MAMLAEPRRKQKFSNDPRNLNWSNDDNRFGQKLMERMGWQKGKGLGANEDGNRNHVAVNLKNDTYGVGCSKDHADNWVAHQDDFNELLSALNENNSTETPTKTAVQNLEEKSKSAKGRIHYKKFAKGKDLTNAKSDDLNCIFGRRLSKSAPSTPQCQSEASSDAEEICFESIVPTTTSSLSVQDYFKQKMEAMKAKTQDVSLSVPTSTNPSDEESRDLDSSYSKHDNESSRKKKKKSKKKSKYCDAEREDCVDERLLSKSKDSKKRKKDEHKGEELEDNPAETNEPEDEQKADKSSKKKKRKRDRREPEGEEENNVSKSKKKKNTELDEKEYKESDTSEKVKADSSENISENENKDNVSEKSKKRKKKKQKKEK